ncbi:hypothetical protein H5410_042937 [Solanum commersonii]|uniref:Uncharacterized protein n=1 Tax=Solanum commersonii TaxID=4109 RepID=A0A9J5XXS7_SOLCO|nr:hypothetical protein H5410_042937 [Solanum commersonii]
MGSYMQWIYHGEQSQMRYDNEVIYNEDENEEHDNDDEIETMLEELLKDAFNGETLPKSYYDAKNMLQDRQECPHQATRGGKLIMERTKRFLIKEHREELLKQAIVNINVKHREQFPLWFKRKIMLLYNKEKSMPIRKLYPLAMGLMCVEEHILVVL